MNKVPMHEYYALLDKVLNTGVESQNRTGINTLSTFGEQIKFNLNDGFPLLTGKHTSFKLIAAELLWFLSGSTNNESLRDKNQSPNPTIWEKWAVKIPGGVSNGSLGPIYGRQWRDFGVDGCEYGDQITRLVTGLKKNPFSRRHIISAWNPRFLPDELKSPQQNVLSGKMALAPCHYSSQFNVKELLASERAARFMPKEFLQAWMTSVAICHESSIDGIDSAMISIMDKMNIPKYELSCLTNIRSNDLFLGCPYNIASYALLTHMLAHVCNMTVGNLIISIGNAHIYTNHIHHAKQLLSRDLGAFKLPKLKIKDLEPNYADYEKLLGFGLSNFELTEYQSHPSIKAEVAL